VDDKFDEQQFGGLRGRSTVHVLIDIVHTWHQALDKTLSFRVMFINPSISQRFLKCPK